MGKTYKGKICVYCASKIADTDEHVFSRQFFEVANRADLPKAPACKECNGRKSKLEHYLTAVMPFGGRHSDAVKILKNMVPPRLAKNAKLKKNLDDGCRQVWIRGTSGFYVNTVSVPVRAIELGEWAAYVVRGLMWHHWKQYLAKDDSVQTFFLQRGRQVLNRETVIDERL